LGQVLAFWFWFCCTVFEAEAVIAGFDDDTGALVEFGEQMEE